MVLAALKVHKTTSKMGRPFFSIPHTLPPKECLVPSTALKAGSQCDTRPHIVLRHAHCNTTKCKDRLGSYPCAPLHCVLASGHEKSRNLHA